MTRQNHIIRQQVFQVDLPGREHAQELYGKTSSLFNHELAGMMEKLFDELVPEDRLLKIETLELDLGVCAYGDFEQTLMDSLIPALRKELSSRLLLQEYESAPADSNAPASGNTHAALLSHYLATGTLPWWATGDLLTDPGKVFDHLLAADPAALKNLLQYAGRYEHARQRIIYQFSEGQVRSVISLFEPQQAAFIFGYHHEVIRVQQEEQVVQEELSGFRKTIWFFILTFLLVDKSSHFDRRMFVKSTLSQMAAHFNVSYEELLLLFSSALEEPGVLSHADDALPLLIRELLGEYLKARPVERARISERGVQKDSRSAIIQKQYNALRYYLLLGSLPGHHMQGMEELAASLTMLKQAAPALARQLLMDTGAVESARKRMAAFGEPFVTEVVNLVEPAHAAFIKGYASKVQQLQATRSIVKIRNDQFRQALWEFIFAFLFTDTGSLFNAKMFVEDHVRRMARHYNLQFHELLVFMAQAVGEDYKSASGSTSLFYLLAGILKDHSGEPGFAGSADETAKDENAAGPQTKIPAHVAGRDVLAYWLRHGFMPWWTEDGLHLLPHERFEALFERSPAEALFLMKLAGTSPAMKSRMLFQLPEHLLLKLFGLLPQGAVASGLLSELAAMAGKHAPSGEVNLQLMLPGLLWDTYEASSYGSFNRTAFIEQVIHGLANATNRPAKDIARLLSNERPSLLAGVSNKELITGQDAWPVDKGAYTDLHTLLMKRLGKGDAITKDMLVSEAIDVLGYFLRHNTWPPGVKPGDDAHALALIRQLMLFLYHENKQALTNILNENMHTAGARMRLHDAVSIEESGPVKHVAAMLDGHFNTDVLHYIQEQEPGSLQAGDKLSSLLERLLRLNDAGQRMSWQQLFRSEAIARHAAYQYRGNDFYQVISTLGHEASAGFLKDLQYLLNRAARDTMEREKLSLLFREFSLLFFSKAFRSPDPALYLREFFAFLSAKRKNMAHLAPAMLKGVDGLPERGKTGIAQLIPLLAADIEKQAGAGAASALLNEAFHKAMQQTLDDLAPLDPGEAPLQALRELSDDTDQKRRMEESIQQQAADLPDEHVKIYIANAGLVLLHPFIPVFFERTGLTEKHRFLSDEKQRRAVHLLEFAVRGTDIHDEQFLVLNKLLCGMPPEMPVEKNITLTDHEKQVADELLQMVISRWEKIGSTSKEGLRETFLVRNGSLSPGDEAWTLKVDNKAFDVLLPYLPWAFGIVKTPWMQKPIHVEWM